MPFMRTANIASEHFPRNEPHALATPCIFRHVRVGTDAPRVVKPGEPVVGSAVNKADAPAFQRHAVGTAFFDPHMPGVKISAQQQALHRCMVPQFYRAQRPRVSGCFALGVSPHALGPAQVNMLRAVQVLGC